MSKATRFDLHQMVTDKIIDGLEKAKNMGYVSPWYGLTKSHPENSITKKKYSGINVLLLFFAQEAGNHKSSSWLTAKQCMAQGGHIIKGSKATQIVFYSKKERVKDDGNDEVYMIMRYYNVFNLDQTSLYNPESFTMKADQENPDALLEFEERIKPYLNNNGPAIQFKEGEGAYYSPNLDKIFLPPKEQFKSTADLISTAAHELIHSTAKISRLHRVFNYKVRAERAQEEIIADLGSAMICAELGVTGMHCTHESYIASWLTALKSDKKFIFKVVKHCSLATQMVLADAKQESLGMSQAS